MSGAEFLAFTFFSAMLAFGLCYAIWGGNDRGDD